MLGSIIIGDWGTNFNHSYKAAFTKTNNISLWRGGRAACPLFGVCASHLMWGCHAQLFRAPSATWAQHQLGFVQTVLERRHTDPSLCRQLWSGVRLHFSEQLGQRQQLSGDTLHRNQANRTHIVVFLLFLFAFYYRYEVSQQTSRCSSHSGSSSLASPGVSKRSEVRASRQRVALHAALKYSSLLSECEASVFLWRDRNNISATWKTFPDLHSSP